MALPSPSARRHLTAARVAVALAAGALGLSANAYSAPEKDGGPAAPVTPDSSTLDEAMRDVDSPFFGLREAAVATLRSLGAPAKPAVRTAFREGSERRRSVLSRVLAYGADLGDIQLLLEALTTAKDPATASALRIALIEHADESAAMLATLRASVPTPSPALVQLEDLLARARMEALFVSRKSKSGGTGSYPGQYDVMRVDRKRALELCVAILANEDLPRPGVYPIGSFRFLRPPEVRISEEEVREMAANAVAELCEPGDTGVIERLKKIHFELDNAKPQRNDFRPRVGAIIALGLDDIVLPTLVSLEALDPYAIDERVEYHEKRGDFDEAAHLRMRMRQFEEAVWLFERQAAQRGRMVIPFYNLACAYSRWSADKELSERQRKHKIELAVKALAQSVAYGYADWPWMEEDKDLEPIRKEAGYARIVEGLKKQYPPLVKSSRGAPPR